METIFKIKTREKITLISKKKQEIYEYGGDTYWIEVPIVNKQDEILRTVEDVLKNICSDQETKRGVYKKIITTTTIDDNFPDVLLLKYARFNSSGKKICKQDVKCGEGLTFKSTYYKLKGVIAHEGDSIKKGQYIGIIQDNSTASYEIIHPKNFKGYPSKLIDQAYVLLFERTGVENKITV